MPLDRNAQEACPPLVFADCQQGAAEWRTQKQGLQANGDRKYEQQEVVERGAVVGDVDGSEAKMQRLTGEAAQAVVSAGQVVPTVSNIERHLAECDRDHREITPAPAHDQQAEQRAQSTTEQNP